MAQVRQETRKLLESQLEPIRARFPVRVADCSDRQSINNNAVDFARYSPDFDSDVTFSSSDETVARDAYTPDSDWSTSTSSCSSDEEWERNEDPFTRTEDGFLPLPPSCTCLCPPQPVYCQPRYWKDADSVSPEYHTP